MEVTEAQLRGAVTEALKKWSNPTNAGEWDSEKQCMVPGSFVSLEDLIVKEVKA